MIWGQACSEFVKPHSMLSFYYLRSSYPLTWLRWQLCERQQDPADQCTLERGNKPGKQLTHKHSTRPQIQGRSSDSAGGLKKPSREVMLYTSTHGCCVCQGVSEDWCHSCHSQVSPKQRCSAMLSLTAINSSVNT